MPATSPPVKLDGDPRLSPFAVAGPSDQQIEQGARLIFDKANPDTPQTASVDRDQWFADTRDYWIRAARDVAAVLGTPMTITCPCGWAAAGPAHETYFAGSTHRCELTDPQWNRWNRSTTPTE